MLSCNVTVYGADDNCTLVVHAHSRADIYYEIAELCAEFDEESGEQISVIKLDTILSE